MPQSSTLPEASAITEQLERLLASPDFDASSRGRALLRFMVGETLADRRQGLTLATIARRVLFSREARLIFPGVIFFLPVKHFSCNFLVKELEQSTISAGHPKMMRRADDSGNAR